MREKRKDTKGIVLRSGEYQRPNGRYEFKYKDSEDKRRSLTADTLKELRKLEDNITQKKLTGIKTGIDFTTNDMYNEWKKLKRGLKKNTYQNYTYMYEKFVQKSRIGKMKIVDMKRSDVKKFYNSLLDKKGFKANSIDCVHTVLHQVLQVAVEDDYIRYNPSDNAMTELKKEAKKTGNAKRVRALTLEEQSRFLDFMLNSKTYSHFYPIFALMLFTGMRVGEITGLRWCDVDFNTNTISVNHTLVYFQEDGKQTFRINTTKTAAGFRTIPLSDRARLALGMQKLNLQQSNIKCNSVIDEYTDFIFLNRFGNAQQQGTLNKALRERIIRDANAEAIEKGLVLLPAFSCHSLRHTFCTNLCRAGIDVKTIMEVIGHSDSATTLEIYAEATADMKEKAINVKLDDYLKDMK